MNDPEVTMTSAFTTIRFTAHEKALEAAGDAIALVMRVPAPLKSIADQLIRSASSAPARPAAGRRATASSSRSEDGCGSRRIVVRHKPQGGAVTWQRAMVAAEETVCTSSESPTRRPRRSTAT